MVTVVNNHGKSLNADVLSIARKNISIVFKHSIIPFVQFSFKHQISNTPNAQPPDISPVVKK